MSGGTAAAWVAAAVAAVGVGVSAQSAGEQKKANAESQAQQQKALSQQKDQQAAAEKYQSDQLKQAQEATNKTNQKRPDTAGVLAAAQQAGKSGASGTMLTGSQGVDPSALSLGKNTLLGM